MMLPLDLIRARRRQSKIRPLYANKGKRSLAETLIAVYSEHVEKKKGVLREALRGCEELGYDYKLVRGLASVLETRCVFQTRSVVPPLIARTEVFTEAARRVITSREERLQVLEAVGRRLGLKPSDLDESLYADLEDELILADFNIPKPEELVRYYNFFLTVALLAYSRDITLTHPDPDDYLEKITRKIGKTSLRTVKGATSYKIELKPSRRLAQRGAKMEELLTRLLKKKGWSLSAHVAYPERYRQTCLLELSIEREGKIMEPDPHLMETIIEIRPRRRLKKAPSFGDVIILEELAMRRGITEAELLRQIKAEGVEYKDLGGVLVTPGRLKEIRGALGGAGELTLGVAQRVLRKNGCRSPLPVLKALGYVVEWRKPRLESRVYRLGR